MCYFELKTADFVWDMTELLRQHEFQCSWKRVKTSEAHDLLLVDKSSKGVEYED